MSGNGTFGVDDTFPICPVCDLSRVLHFFPQAHCHINIAILLVALFKSENKTTCRFLKSCMWLRKPQVGMQPCNPHTAVWRGNNSKESSKYTLMPLQAKFCILFSALKSLLAVHLRRLKNIIYSI
jgi:hypothetical protein